MKQNNEKLFNIGVSKTMHKQYKEACQYFMYSMRAPLLRKMSEIINQYNTEVGRGRTKKGKSV